MKDNIFTQYLTDIEDLEASSDNIQSIEGNFKVGETVVRVSVEIKHQDESDIIRLKAERSYNFEILPSSCEAFNEEALDKYGNTYNIYGHRNSFFLSKKTIIKPDYGLDMICEEIFSILEEAVKLFEKKCVNFMKKYSDSEEEHTLDPELKERSDDNVSLSVADETEFTVAFWVEQKKIAEQAFSRLAKTYSVLPETSDMEDLFFKVKKEDNTLTVLLKNDSSELEAAYSVEAAEIRGLALLANAKATYPEYFSIYEDGVFSIKTYITPDEYLPEAEEDEIKKLKEAFATCIHITVEEEQSQGMGSVAADFQQVMSGQMQKLQQKEKSLNERESLLAEKESKLREKVRLFEEEKKRQVSVIADKIDKLNQREKDLYDMEAHLQAERETAESEKVQYDNQFNNMVIELKRMRARTENSHDFAESDLKRLQKKVDSITKARTMMEKQLKNELQASQEKVRQLMRDIQKKEFEYTELKGDLRVQANQMFQAERDAYEKEIRELKECANITEEDINPHTFLKYLKEKTEFSEVVLQHAKDKIVLSFNPENYSVKVVFGNLLFVDVIRTFRKAVDSRTVSTLNNQFSDIKFFMNDKKTVTARKYFSIHILSAELVQIIRDLMSNFE